MRTIDRRSISSLLTCTALSMFLFACAHDSATHGHSGELVAEIPFTLTSHNNIIVRAHVNETDAVDLMFHTAASGVYLIEAARAKAPSVRYGGEATAQSWGGRGTTRHSSGNSLRIGGMVWDAVAILEDKRSGPGSDGKFGPDLFGDKIVEIDFDRLCLRIHRSVPAACARYDSLPVRTKIGSPFVEASIEIDGVAYRNDFMLHSGFAGTLLFDDAFAARVKLLDKLEVLRTSELRDSMGKTLKTRHVAVPAIALASTSFARVPVAVFDGSFGKQKFSVLGGAVLRRFHWFLDLAKGHRVYFAPNRHAAQPFVDRRA